MVRVRIRSCPAELEPQIRSDISSFEKASRGNVFYERVFIAFDKLPCRKLFKGQPYSQTSRLKAEIALDHLLTRLYILSLFRLAFQELIIEDLPIIYPTLTVAQNLVN